MSAVKTDWSPVIMRIYQKYPAAFKTAAWGKIVRFAEDGDTNAAEQLAKEHEGSHKSIRAQNVIARRIRIQRVQLFKLQKDHVAKIKMLFQDAAFLLSNRMIHLPNNVSAIAPMRAKTRVVMVNLRRSLNVVITDLVWQSIVLGVKNMGEAIKPIFRDNAESFQEELKDVQLIEDRLTIGVSKRLAGKSQGAVDLGSEKWQTILDGIYTDVVKSNMNGLTLSERIWDLSNRAEQDLRRIVATEVSLGTSARDIADQIQKYIYTEGIDTDFQPGPGIYRSPLKNALRLARTETNRAYTQATAAWADNKPWVKAIRVTLSPAHDKADDCDDIAGNEYSPEEFADVIPVHPHCMCFGTYVIDENYLTGNAPAPEEDSE